MKKKNQTHEKLWLVEYKVKYKKLHREVVFYKIVFNVMNRDYCRVKGQKSCTGWSKEEQIIIRNSNLKSHE